MKLRSYQIEARDAIYQYFIDGNKGNPLVAMPTGTGKSLVIADFIKTACIQYPNTKVLMLTHVKELIVQNMKALINIWPTAPAGIYSAGLKQKNANYQITYGGIQSCHKVPEVFGHIDLILIDEAHLVPPRLTSTYGKLLNMLTKWNPKSKIIGFTATPFRLGQGMLTDPGGIFTDVCYDITGRDAFNRLIDEGYLCNLVTKRTNKELNVDDVKIQAGEFILTRLQEAVDQDAITDIILDELIEEGKYRKHWLIFGTGIQHCCNIRDMLELKGIHSTVVHSNLDDNIRDQRIVDFKVGKYRAMVNNMILSTGFDFPEIDLLADLQPTCSPGKHVQKYGRGARPKEGGRDCLVLDFAGNTRRLGPINDPVIPKRKNKKGGGEAPVKICECCNTYNHASVNECTQCGEPFPKHTKLEEKSSTREIIIRTDVPEVSIFPVDHVTYRRHTKKDRPDSIQVNYHCGIRRFIEWICFEHEGYAYHKAKDWWRARSTEEIPETTDQALQRIDKVDTPTHVRVWFNKKYPEIMDIDFSGTTFKLKPPADIPGKMLS